MQKNSKEGTLQKNTIKYVIPNYPDQIFINNAITLKQIYSVK